MTDLAYFGHHPDESTDFCIEVDNVLALGHDASRGLGSERPFWGHLSRALRWARAHAADEIGERAKTELRTYERRFLAGEFGANHD